MIIYYLKLYSKIKILIILLMLMPASAIAVENPIVLNALLRGYYFNDHRLINGLESTFAAEGVIGVKAEESCGACTVGATGEFYLNQPFSKNVSKNQTRAIYTTVYDADPFEVSELYLWLRYGPLVGKLGKTVTPFGRYYFPIYSNSHFDAPFIRTEAVLWKETGLFVRYHPNAFSFEVAVTNGETEKDTNSSKAIISRLGFDADNWAFGVSIKQQDGKGSEDLKVYNNHAGMDFMIRSGSVTLSGEFIYDEYGCANADCTKDPERISLYHRDIFVGEDEKITGIGGYLDIFYDGVRWDIDLNYGLYQPEKVGNPYHDDPIHRGVLKTAYRISKSIRAFFSGLIENERKTDASRGTRNAHNNYAFMTGLTYCRY